MAQNNNYDNAGSLFINDRKTTDKHPDYKGNIMVDGKKYWVSGWLKTRDKRDRTGKVSFISLSVEKADDTEVRSAVGFPTLNGSSPAAPAPARPAARPAPAPVSAPATEEDNADNDLPF